MSDGIGAFFGSVIYSMTEVAKIPHVWLAAIIGAITFGTMLAAGVVWMPKLLHAHGLSPAISALGASMLWLGLAVGSVVLVRWSDHIQQRKLPTIIGVIAQLVTLGALLYLGNVGPAFALIMCFTFGFFNSAHMLSLARPPTSEARADRYVRLHRQWPDVHCRRLFHQRPRRTNSRAQAAGLTGLAGRNTRPCRS